MSTKLQSGVLNIFIAICFLPLIVNAREGKTYALEKVTGEWEKTIQVFDKCENYVSDTFYSSLAVYVQCENNDGSSTFYKVTFSESGEMLEDDLGTFSDTVSFVDISAAGRFLTLSASSHKSIEFAYRIYDAWEREWAAIPEDAGIYGIDMSDSGKGLAKRISDNGNSYVIIDRKANVVEENIQFVANINGEDIVFPNASSYRDAVVALSPNGEYASIMVTDLDKESGVGSDFALLEVKGLLNDDAPKSSLLWSATESKTLQNSAYATPLGENHIGRLMFHSNAYATTPSDLTLLFAFFPWRDSSEINKDSPLILKYSSKEVKEESIDIKSVEQSPLGYKAKNNKYHLWDGTDISNVLSRGSPVDIGGFFVPTKSGAMVYAVWYDGEAKKLIFYRAPALLKAISFPIDQ